MTDFTQTIENTLTVYGGKPASLWDAAIWDEDYWDNAASFEKGIEKYIPNSVLVTGATITRSIEKLISNLVLGTSAEIKFIEKLHSETCGISDIVIKSTEKLILDSFTATSAITKAIEKLVSDTITPTSSQTKSIAIIIRDTFTGTSVINVTQRDDAGYYLVFVSDTINLEDADYPTVYQNVTEPSSTYVTSSTTSTWVES